MRKVRKNLTLFDAPLPNPNHPKAKEYVRVSALLDAHPEWSERITACLLREVPETLDPAKGRGDALTGEQVLRIAIVKFREQYSYRDLAFWVMDSDTLRWFCRLGGRTPPGHTTLQEVISSIDAKTMLEINEGLVKAIVAGDEEERDRVRVDTTVVKTDILYPSDSGLMQAAVRRLTALMQQAREQVIATSTLPFHDRRKAAKNAAFRVSQARGKNADAKRRKNYKQLFALLREVRGLAPAFVCELARQQDSSNVWERMAARWLHRKLTHFLALAARVYDQADRRINQGERLAADEKLYSLFETHTDCIRRGKVHEPTEFGHKVFFSTGASGLILDYHVCDGNPSDHTLLPAALERHASRFGCVPQELTADRSFYTKDNVSDETTGVARIAIPKPGPQTSKSQAAGKQRWYKMLLRFRAGIEATISWLARSFGLRCCRWKSREHYDAYVGWAVLTCNLTQYARPTA